MLLLWSEIEYAFIGCWRLLRGDRSGVALIDVSADGFWKSFRIAGLLAVFDALDALLAQIFSLGDEASSLTLAGAVWILVVSAVTSVVAFCAFPVAAGLLAKPMGISAHYGPYITVRNWLIAFLSLPIYVLDAFAYSNSLPGDVIGLLMITVDLIVLFAGYGIARNVLGCSRSFALGLSLMDFLLALLISKLAFNLL